MVNQKCEKWETSKLGNIRNVKCQKYEMKINEKCEMLEIKT